MLTCCMNPVCHAEFRLLDSGGDYYSLERRGKNTEFFWLCVGCAERYELYLDANEGIMLRSRRDRWHCDLPCINANLRLVAHAARRRQTTPGGERALFDRSIPVPSHSNQRLHGF